MKEIKILLWFLLALGEFTLVYFTLIAISLNVISLWGFLFAAYFAFSCIHSVITMAVLWESR